LALLLQSISNMMTENATLACTNVTQLLPFDLNF